MGMGNAMKSNPMKTDLAAGKLKPPQIRALWRAIRQVLTEAIRFGSTIPLFHGASAQRKGAVLFDLGIHCERAQNKRREHAHWHSIRDSLRLESSTTAPGNGSC